MRIIGIKCLALYTFLGVGIHDDCDYDGAVSALGTCKMLSSNQAIRPFIQHRVRPHELNPHTSLKRLYTLSCARSGGLSGLKVDEASRLLSYQAPGLTSKERIRVCSMYKLSMVSKAPEMMKPLFPENSMRHVERRWCLSRDPIKHHDRCYEGVLIRIKHLRFVSRLEFIQFLRRNIQRVSIGKFHG